MGVMNSCCSETITDKHETKHLKIIKTLNIKLHKDYYVVNFLIKDGTEGKITCKTVDDFLEKLPK